MCALIKMLIQLPIMSRSGKKATRIKERTKMLYLVIGLNKEEIDRAVDFIIKDEGKEVLRFKTLLEGIETTGNLPDVYNSTTTELGKYVGGGKDAGGKSIKPPGWTPPAIKAILDEQISQ